MFADRKSQSPESAPSGVKQDIFVTFMTCSRYSRGSLQEKRLLNKREGEGERERERKKMFSRKCRVHINAILPFKFRPHTAELDIKENKQERKAKREEKHR